MLHETDLTIHAGGMDFHATQVGNEPRTIFLHGFAEDQHTWDRLWSALDGSLQALRYDLRGYGQSPDPTTTKFSHSDDLLAILDSLSIAKVSLVGISMGGAIALNFALSHPQRVDKLVLISPGMVAWEWSEAWRAQWGAVVAEARAGNLEKARTLWWQHPLFATTRKTSAAGALRQSIMRFSGDQWIKDRQEQSMPDIDRIYTLAVPTLLLTGGEDLEDFRLISDVVEASAQNVTRVDYPQLGHLIHQEEPQACALEIIRFLGVAD